MVGVGHGFRLFLFVMIIKVFTLVESSTQAKQRFLKKARKNFWNIYVVVSNALLVFFLSQSCPNLFA
jgi:hypothetical protein